ncbi:hypothetical protein CC85DRAFT_318894 [Cutaneotrichosporon oleaginosum]|uniref:Uncharacterized protein n=1 Tax=Cutaneotrichosporon oleaginosum TaxID=879819 RepID=A0A0J0XMG1_9TREE|nr:uncharacterized protein CC85DRAFT_318894 [Cutaneotrichosporon oleaginosum]KLT42335.1 hypothetical protein CC85DRAFT_318894 [Cutaneotrichosporon oleaginosum]TXT04155.1 hypothetical protein COLE_07852 [Cutaneotrichosporon oleaginosum]
MDLRSSPKRRSAESMPGGTTARRSSRARLDTPPRGTKRRRVHSGDRTEFSETSGDSGDSESDGHDYDDELPGHPPDSLKDLRDPLMDMFEDNQLMAILARHLSARVGGVVRRSITKGVRDVIEHLDSGSSEGAQGAQEVRDLRQELTRVERRIIDTLSADTEGRQKAINDRLDQVFMSLQIMQGRLQLLEKTVAKLREDAYDQAQMINSTIAVSRPPLAMNSDSDDDGGSERPTLPSFFGDPWFFRQPVRGDREERDQGCSEACCTGSDSDCSDAESAGRPANSRPKDSRAQNISVFPMSTASYDDVNSPEGHYSLPVTLCLVIEDMTCHMLIDGLQSPSIPMYSGPSLMWILRTLGGVMNPGKRVVAAKCNEYPHDAHLNSLFGPAPRSVPIVIPEDTKVSSLIPRCSKSVPPTIKVAFVLRMRPMRRLIS